jgi:hypothetical protein
MARLTANFTCSNCGAVYQCETQDYIAWGHHEFRCQRCQTVVHVWEGTLDYTNFKMVKEPDRT